MNYQLMIIGLFFQSTLNNAIASTVTLSKPEWNYPEVRRDDDYSYERFGQKIPDPYHWLEDPKSEETLSFVKEQNKLTEQYTREYEHYESIKSEYTNYDLPSKQNNKYYLSILHPNNNHAVFYSMDSLDDQNPKAFIDPNKFSDNDTVSLTFTSFSDDGKWCAYGIASDGSDWNKIKIRNVQTMEDLDDELVKIKFSTVAWNKNNKGFFYAYYDNYNGTTDGTETEAPKCQKLYYHRLNTPQDKDILIHEFPEHPNWLIKTFVISKDGKTIYLFPTKGSSNAVWLYAKFDPEFDETYKFDFKWIVKKMDSEFHYISDDNNCVYLRTNYRAKNFRLVCANKHNLSRNRWHTIIPETKSQLSWVVLVNKSYLACIYKRYGTNILQMHNLYSGRHLFNIGSTLGSITAMSSKPESKEFFFKVRSFLKPPTIYHYDFKRFSSRPFGSKNRHKIKIFRQSTISTLDPDEFKIEKVFYKSKDGTSIPMFIFSRKDLVKNGSNPTWLYAYTGFNTALYAKYHLLTTFFVKYLNGVFVLSTVRGSSEFGLPKEGKHLNKQNVFDDFVKAGEYLIENGYTSREYLIANGRCSRGLLIAASNNQRPDLFGTVIVEVSMMDMLKFPLFTIGHAWVAKYGDPVNNKTDFNYIYKYSPLHNVPSDPNQYPNMLVLTGDHDGRVVPLHSYKFISEVQYQLRKKFPQTPMMLRVEYNSGHGLITPINKWINYYSDVISFVLRSTPIQYRPSCNCDT